MKAGAAPSPAPPRHPAGSRGRVLLVDDDPHLQELSMAVLGGAGFSVNGVSSAVECLEALGTELPDLILLDIHLPDLCGLELGRRIKADPATAQVMIVHFSGDRVASEKEMGESEAGMDGYIVRPISNRELVARVAALLRIKRAEAEVRRLHDELSSASQALRQMKDDAREGTGPQEEDRQFRESEEWFRQLAENVDDAFWILDAHRPRIIYANPAFQRLLGRPGEPLHPHATSYLEAIHPQDRERVRLAGEKTPGEFNEEYRVVQPDGKVCWHWSRMFPIHDAAGRLYRLGGIARDITARKEAEALIREQAALLDGAQEVIFVQDLDGIVLFWNKSAARTYDCPAAEMLGRRFTPCSANSQESYAAAWQQVREKGDWIGEFTEHTRAGRELIIEGHWTLVRDSDGAPKSVLCINTDITDRKRLETQFLRAQRMESIGTLAGGIAHDLNNVLSPIVLAIELLKLKHDDAATLDVLDTLETNAHRGADMVRQVLSFARGVEGQRLPVQPKYLLRDVQKIVRETFPKNLECTTTTAPDLWNVVGDSTQLHQVLLNLCVNARDAMPHGGRLTITADNVLLDENYVAMNIEAQVGPHVVFHIQDSGTGIPAETLEKIFDPFFTTKELGQGTGLGLSTSRAIVRSHGGFIRVYSEVGRGSSFMVHLPAQSGPAGETKEAAPAGLPRGNGELILVIDDEDSIRTITRQTLEAFGYRCLLAADGAEAVALFAQHQGEVTAVITDMMMPLMDGPATIQILRRLDPKLPIIAASGLSENSHLAKVASLDVQHFLPKPYTAETLLKGLRRLLVDG